MSLNKDNNKNEDIRENINNNYFNNFNRIKVGQYSTLLNERNKKYFKINTKTFTNNNNSENNSKTPNKNMKLYKKPNQITSENKLYIYKSQKNINDEQYSFKIITPDNKSSNFHKFNKNQNKKIKNLKEMKNNNEKRKIKINQDDLYLNENNENQNQNRILLNSITNPKMTTYNIKLPFSNNDNILNQKQKKNSIKNLPNSFHNKNLSMTEYSSFIPINKDLNKLIIKNEKEKSIEKKNINKRFKIPKSEDNNRNNNNIPIQSKEKEKNEQNIIQFIVPRNMIEQLNKKIEISKKEKKRKINYSFDSKITDKNGYLIKNNNLYDKEEINNENEKKYKIRSVVRVIKKNKSLNNLIENNNKTKNEEKDIIEEIKKEIKETKEERIRHNKIIKILREEIENFVSFYNNNNNENNTENNNYDLSIIEQLIIKVKVDLIDIINSFLLICDELIDSKNKLKICIEYINLLFDFYKQNYLNENNIELIHIKLLKILFNIGNFSINNIYKYEIIGNIFYYFLKEQMFYEKDLNYFVNDNEKVIIEIAKVVKYIIILSSIDKKIANERYFKFKNTKLFNKNPIYFNYVTKYLNSILNI